MPPTPSWLCGGIFSSAGISPQPSLPTESVRYLPTLPVEFPKPSGNDGDLELRSRRADSHALAATTTAFVYTRFSVFVALSMYETASAFPSLPTTISRAIAPVINGSLPVAMAGGSRTWLELKFDAVMQPRPHCPQ